MIGSGIVLVVIGGVVVALSSWTVRIERGWWGSDPSSRPGALWQARLFLIRLAGAGVVLGGLSLIVRGLR
jgi:hypothetical protein